MGERVMEILDFKPDKKTDEEQVVVSGDEGAEEPQAARQDMQVPGQIIVKYKPPPVKIAPIGIDAMDKLKKSIKKNVSGLLGKGFKNR